MNIIYVLLFVAISRKAFARRVLIHGERKKRTQSPSLDGQCTDFCVKCPDTKSVFVQRKTGSSKCNVDLITSSNGQKNGTQRFLTSGGFWRSQTGTAKLLVSTQMGSIKNRQDMVAARACQNLEHGDIEIKDIANCAAHSLLCGEGEQENVVGMFGKPLPVSEAQCVRLSAQEDMPCDVSDYVFDADADVEESSNETIPEARPPVINSAKRDCGTLQERDGVYRSSKCSTTDGCAWIKLFQKCVALCDHPSVRDSEVPCSAQSNCLWNSKESNRYTGKSGICQYKCKKGKKGDAPCPREKELRKASFLHALSRSQKEDAKFYEWSRPLEEKQHCYDPSLVKEQLEFDSKQKEAPAARICDYAHSQSWLHQFFKHDGSINCHELPPIDMRKVNEEHKRLYLEAGCWPFARSAAAVHRIQDLIGQAQAGGKSKKKSESHDLLVQAVDQEDVMQRLAKYSFDSATDGFDAGPNSSVAVLQLQFAANRRLFAQLLQYSARQLCETKKLPPIPKEPFLRLSEQLHSPTAIRDVLQEQALRKVNGSSREKEQMGEVVKLAFQVTSTILKQIIARDQQSGEDTFAKSPKLRHDMQCIPALWGRTGFVTGGMRNDGNYMMTRTGHSYSNRLICEIGAEDENVNETIRSIGPFKFSRREKCVESCSLQASVSSSCSRMAATHLNFWMVKLYGEKMGLVNQFRTSAAMCLDRSSAPTQTSNCWLFQDCMKEVISKVICKLHPDCCAGALAAWYPIPENSDKLVLEPNEWSIVDTPATRLAAFCNKHPRSPQC